MASINKVDDFLYEDLTFKIRGCAFRVHNALGSGHKEIVYQKALAQEFSDEGLQFEREKSLPVLYGEEKIGVYRSDFIIDNKIIVEIKALRFMPNESEKQLLYYLEGIGFKLGLLINFGGKKVYIVRRINSNQRKNQR